MSDSGGHPSSGRWALLLLAATLVGCGRNDVRVYRVAKDQAPAAPTPALPPGHPDTSGAMPNLQWKLPAGWEQVTPGQMRLASFRVNGRDGKQADVGIFPLPGAAGSDLDNVNRWRSQVGQPPVPEEELAKLAQAVEVAGQTAQLYDQAGTNAGSGEKSRILAAIMHRESVTWFFKMAGDDELVAQQKPAFVEFLKSLSFASAQAGLPPSHPPIDSGSLAAQAGPAAAAGQDKPTWQVPSSWKEVPGSQFLVAKFLISGSDNAQAAVNVSRSAGEGGGVVGNVNRWRQQLGLGELPVDEVNKLVQTLPVAGGQAQWVDLSGTDSRTGLKARLLGVIVPQAGQTWFYKLMGDDSVVAREKDAFLKFVQSARY